MTNTIEGEALRACEFCGTADHLSVMAVGSLMLDMPARPYQVACHHLDCEDVRGPVGYGRAAAIAAWNRRSALDAPEPVVKVRELEWRKAGVRFQAASYEILPVINSGPHPFRLEGVGPEMLWFGTLELAQAAAQEHYSTAIRSAIDPSPATDARIAEALRLLLDAVDALTGTLGTGGYFPTAGAPKTNALISAANEARAFLATQNGD